MFILWKFKQSMQKSIFPQNFQTSLCITTKSLYTNSKFQTQLSWKLQRFRTCRKNKKCIPEAWKCFLDPDSGNGVGVLKRKSNIFGFLWENRRFLGFSRRGIDCTHSRTLKTLPWPWFRKGIGVLKRKSNIFGFLWENRRFLGFSRRGIDCAHSRTVKTLL